MEYVGIAIGIMIGAIMTLCVWAISDCMINRKKIVMTQEEKARAYDEALERARKLYNDAKANEYKSDMEDYESIFPELAESEDERIRKELVEAFEALDIDSSWNGIPVKSILAWLEKHKENPKSADSIPSDCVSDVRCEDRWHKVGDSLPDNGRLVLAKDCLGNVLLARYDGENWEVNVYDNEDHYCHNSISKWCEIPSEKQKEHKPAEWNDTDMKEARNNLISVCRDWERGMQTALLPIAAVRARYFLEHLTEPKPVEWSEEDENVYKTIMDDFNGITPMSKAYKLKAAGWLKSLRLQYHGDVTMTEAYKMGKEAGEASRWKPSEEQMEALYRCVDYLEESDNEDAEFMESLLEQLKKLM